MKEGRGRTDEAMRKEEEAGGRREQRGKMECSDS